MTAMTPTPTLAEALALALRLPLRERARLIALIAQNIAMEPATPTTPTIISDAPGTAAGLLTFAGSWEGSDLPERIAEVYATRYPVVG